MRSRVKIQTRVFPQADLVWGRKTNLLCSFVDLPSILIDGVAGITLSGSGCMGEEVTQAGEIEFLFSPVEQELWSYTRPPNDNEPVRNQHRQEIYYYRHCTKHKDTPTSVRFREHLRDNHSIRVTSTEESASRTAFKNIIKDLFGKQAERQKDSDIEPEKQLHAAIQELGA